MAKPRVPKYYGLRIYLSSSILFFFLVIPFLSIMVFQSVPKIVASKEGGLLNRTEAADSLKGSLEEDLIIASGDSLIQELIDSLEISTAQWQDFDQEKTDSIVKATIALGRTFADSAESWREEGEPEAADTGQEEEDINIGEEAHFPEFFSFLFFGTLVSYLLGFIYNWPYKRFFKFLRRKRNISEKLYAYCKRQLFRTPLFNSLILILPNLAAIVYSLSIIFNENHFKGDTEHSMFIQLFFLALVATMLEFLFVFYWMRHRVHIKYIEHVFSKEELRVQVFRNKGGKIRNRFLVASGMTTFLPLMIVMVYLILSLTSIKSLKIESMTKEQREVLIGPWTQLFDRDQENVSTDKYQKLFYVNAVDSLVMLVGIGSGIIVSMIYLLLFIRWTNMDISVPLKELLSNIRRLRGSEAEHYTVVRTNDEIGELAEGYNEMTGKIHAYVESISKMNRELEEKVKERTEEVVLQKEEIEAQKEEIEAQLDLTTRQRDTITYQKDQILDSIRYAERIQSAILPPIEHLADYFTSHFILFHPRDIVSGDYYWTIKKDHKVMIAVADCTGHGVPGAFLSMLGISSMNEIVNRSGAIRASEILEELRQFVIKSLHQTGTKGEAQDGIEIALCVIDTRKRSLEYAGANRPLYLIRNNKLQHYRGDRMPIGIYEQELLPFTNHEIDLELGDSLYLFSDGYVDQLGGPSRKTFRSRYFRQVLLDIQEHPMEEQKRILVDKLNDWKGEVEQIDDILVMGIRV
jgi:serine phosphatase RsbU (regulator of sigma subunit)